MAETAGLLRFQSKDRTSGPSMVMVAFAFHNPKGLTIGEIAGALDVPRPIAVEWITMMERGGLVRRSSRWNFDGGTPIWTYRASPMLRRALSSERKDSMTALSLHMLKDICKFQIDGCCTVSQDHLACGTSNCPYFGLEPTLRPSHTLGH